MGAREAVYTGTTAVQGTAKRLNKRTKDRIMVLSPTGYMSRRILCLWSVVGRRDARRKIRSLVLVQACSDDGKEKMRRWNEVSLRAKIAR